MPRYVVHEASGEIAWTGECATTDMALAQATDDLAVTLLPAGADAPDEKVSWVDDGAVVARPALPGFDPDDLDALPDGTAIRVTNEAGQYLDFTTPSDVLVLRDPGIYRFRVSAPFPIKPFETEVTVDA